MTVTDHSKATLDDAHSHGVVVPASSRAERLTSFDPADFPMPTGREEEWRFTPLDRLSRMLEDVAVAETPKWQLETPPVGVSVVQIESDEARRRCVRAPSDRAGAIAFSRAPRSIRITVAPKAQVARPFEMAILVGGGVIKGNAVIEVGEGASATMIGKVMGSGQMAEFTSIDIADGASFEYVIVREGESDAVHLSDVVVRLGKDASFKAVLVSLSGAVIRANTSVILAGEGADVSLNGLYFAGDGQHIENRVFIDHVAPRCRSRVAFKGALAGETARTVWIGDVLIRAEAEGTDTYELNRNLLLTDGARADSVPNLEIETGEIEGAGHASATGRFDDEQLFYLQSRGIPEAKARTMVVRGFFADIVGRIGISHVEKDLMRSIDTKLGATGE
jgi:Fe-S cluster assembly protein SufD